MTDLLAVDGTSLLVTSRRAAEDFDDPEAGVAHIFLSSLGRVIRDCGDVRNLLVAWDSHPTLREKLNSTYKANRPRPPEGVAGLVTRILREAGVSQQWVELAEADDIIAAHVRGWPRDRDVRIVSGDKDLLQLVVGNRKQWRGGRWWNESDVLAHFGVCGPKLSWFLALAGDTVDGIKGVPGIGPKRAAMIVQEDVGSDMTATADRLAQRASVRDHLSTVVRDEVLINLTTGLPGISVPLVDTSFDVVAVEAQMVRVAADCDLPTISRLAVERSLFTNAGQLTAT